MHPQRLTPKKFAKEIGKGYRFVMTLIENGELVVEDVRSPGAKLPRYEIERSQVAAWRSSRRVRFDPAAEKTIGRTISAVAEVIH